MRSFLLFICILFLPILTKAQFDFKPGSYVLENDIYVRHYSAIKESGKYLTSKIDKDRTVKYLWKDIHSYRIGLRRYIKASGFPVRSQSGFTDETANNIFVELLDSGAVSLMRYEYQPIAGYMPPPNIYLLQRAGETYASAIPYTVFDEGGKRFREYVSLFVSTRPDLLKALKDKRVNINNLQTFIQAFNRGEPFLNYPMQ
ncbi:hypothetical protein GCM10011375_37380 [Hymenobacter qilianensis]|uniref:Uncharacterized protein n=2 Tax=Hymenobacter qilianensis TaxID=1385715 RepID=A0ACB5PWG1_9BACT|nr:hypothetical protein [Hymenobacter qilianensis]QNP51048.1 hypothetical protein H9L05_13080 [Hymenobacter qilianensis]GGF78801.1 hypothetical protein GCM10011375_37380 [Hymenobacter qilianensis]